MRISIDLDTLAVGDFQGSALQALSARRGDAFPVSVRFIQGGVGKELPGAATGRLALKNPQDYSGGLVAGGLAWRKVGHGAAAYYVFPLDLSTQQVGAAFDAEGGSALAQVTFAMEIEWAHRGLRKTSRSVAFVVDNDYIQPDEGTPAAAPDLKATEADALQGIDNTKYMTPLRVAQTLKAASAQQIALSIALG
jgi:hypothetical protein